MNFKKKIKNKFFKIKNNINIRFRYGKYKAPKKIIFNQFEKSLVSIIIPVYNNYKITKECLYSILKNTPNVPYEIIIADDCSNDNTINITDEVPGIKYVRTNKNIGFSGNCVNAIKYANSEYIMLLNNDMLFYYNWLKPMIDMMENDNTIGIVGPIIISPNGRILELGNYMSKNLELVRIGGGLKYNKNKRYPVLEFDYKAGCSILLKRKLWDDLRGFDEQFSPAFYEDTDLCFRVREKGLKVVNCPDSVVIHYETLSYNELNDLINICMENYNKFYYKWKDVLQTKYKDIDELNKDKYNI
jgi:O-antigen biosynthesis protein